MSETNKKDILKTYEVYLRTSSPLVENLFKIILFVVVTILISIGLYLRTIEPVIEEFTNNVKRIKAQFLIKEIVTAKQPIKKKIVKAKSKIKDKPIDLTKKIELNKKNDDIIKSTKIKKVKRVYGLRKVYSKGIGTNGTMADAIIGKLGNTINKDFDTLTATMDEIKGEVVSSTTVTSAPSFKKRIKPKMTDEMIANNIEGVIKVKILVDIDGKVKKAKILNDLGYGSKKQALDACMKMTFVPAKRGNTPVAVWIIIPIRFVKLG